MNIFALDKEPATAAAYHCDKHVVKMILETAQLLCTAHTVLDRVAMPYKPTHVNHPCAVWARSSSLNYDWLWMLGYELCREYTRRYQRTHACEVVIRRACSEPPRYLRAGCQLPFPQCMPDEYKSDDAVLAYRAYYRGEKSYFARWRHSPEPEWMTV